ncbi:hypothetical protein GCM10017668_47890 [Streptomyces tuirus]|uniref:Uncharacterized protein n=1 Tax=Streptomyces tuirus TaxID=68278 RepID=A0A7G1NN30_9ACTN|nr:hypothetical protein GCM10017668_47890 [Streptomyces tuirus]
MELRDDHLLCAAALQPGEAEDDEGQYGDHGDGDAGAHRGDTDQAGEQGRVHALRPAAECGPVRMHVLLPAFTRPCRPWPAARR